MCFYNDGVILEKQLFDKQTIENIKQSVSKLKPDHGFDHNLEFVVDKPKNLYSQYCSENIDDNSFSILNNKIKKIVDQYIEDAVPFGNGNVVVQNSGYNAIMPHLDCPYRFTQYNYEKDLLGVLAFVPLDNFTKENGATGFVKGSHKFQLDNVKCYKGHYNDFYNDNHEQIECEIGDVIIWNAKILHSGMPNHTEYSRAGIAINYVSNSIMDNLYKIMNEQSHSEQYRNDV